MNLPIIISLGGSLIVPEEIDIAFLEGFKEIILREVQAGKRFVIITGGGKICRVGSHCFLPDVRRPVA